MFDALLDFLAFVCEIELVKNDLYELAVFKLEEVNAFILELLELIVEFFSPN